MKISLAIVAYNEEKYLPRLLSDIEKQTYPHENIEIVFVDSASTDGTKKVMEEFALKHDLTQKAYNEELIPKADNQELTHDKSHVSSFLKHTDFYNIAIFDNKKRRLACGCNVAIREFTTDALVRVDAHARIPADFIEECVKGLNGEYVTGGARPTVCERDDPWSRMLWMAEESLFGSSISSARRTTGTHDRIRTASADKKDDRSAGKDSRQYVKSIFHVCCRREVFEKAGGFREDLGRTEDNEFYYRLRKNGYRIYRSPDIYSEQYIRPTLKRMIKQKAGNGYWVGRTLGFVPGCISPYHMVPFGFVAAIVASVIMAVKGNTRFLRFLVSAYGTTATLMAAWSIYTLRRSGGKPPVFSILLPFVFLVLHVCYGAGTVAGISSIPFDRSSAG